MSKVSVIIPVYNVEKYLRQCLDSIINQTLKDIEIICVDDGSTDSSLAILEKYANKDNRIKILKQQNQGAGSARNKGLKIAKGEYLLFLDSDDIYHEDILIAPYNYAKEKNADIVFWNYAKLDMQTNQTSHFKISSELKENINYSTKNKNFSFNNSAPNPWTKLFKKSFINKNNLTFQNLSSCNDIAFVWKSMALANSIYYLDKELITYRTQSVNTISSTRYKKANNIIEAAKEIKKCIKKIKVKGLMDNFYWSIMSCFTYEYKQFPENISTEDYKKQVFAFLPSKYHKEQQQLLETKKYQKKHYLKDYESALEKIFSIKNSKDKKHKILTIFGVKLKFKRRRNA